MTLAPFCGGLWKNVSRETMEKRCCRPQQRFERGAFMPSFGDGDGQHNFVLGLLLAAGRAYAGLIHHAQAPV